MKQNKIEPKTFEYKMCKKVSELTQIINTMFVKATESEYKHRLSIQNCENNIKNLICEFQDREKELKETNKIQILELEKKIEQLVKEREEILKKANNSVKTMVDFTSQFPLTNNEENSLDEKSLDFEKLKQQNNQLKNKIEKLEAKILNERSLNLKLISKLRHHEEKKEHLKNKENANKKEPLNRKQSFDRVSPQQLL